MADIIKFQEYVHASDEEKKRIKMISTLLTKSRNIKGILSAINNCVGCSLVTRQINEKNQVIGRENVIDSDMMSVIINAIKNYDSRIQEKIQELNDSEQNNITT